MSGTNEIKSHLKSMITILEARNDLDHEERELLEELDLFARLKGYRTDESKRTHEFLDQPIEDAFRDPTIVNRLKAAYTYTMRDLMFGIYPNAPVRTRITNIIGEDAVALVETMVNDADLVSRSDDPLYIDTFPNKF